MTTQKQRTANRRNAKKSTGPRTAKGRARSSINALKHGLTAAQITIADEKSEDLENFHRGLIDVLIPVGALEEQLVERIAVCAWRLRRVYRIEAQLFVGAAPHRGIRSEVVQQQVESAEWQDAAMQVAVPQFTIDEMLIVDRFLKIMEDEYNKAKEVASTQTVDQIPSASIADSASASSSVEASREGVRAGSAAVPSPETVFNVGAVFRTLAVSQGPLFQLSRHETTIERSLHRALHDLERLQARRKGEVVMAPLALDISGEG
jgi:hypothetical protein